MSRARRGRVLRVLDVGVDRRTAGYRKRFEVTAFVSEEAIRAAPNSIHGILPAQVCETIKEKLTP